MFMMIDKRKRLLRVVGMAIVLVSLIAVCIGCQQHEEFSWDDVRLLPTYGSVNCFGDQKLEINLGLMTKACHEDAFLSDFETVTEIPTNLPMLRLVPQSIGVSVSNSQYSCYTLVAELQFSALPEEQQTLEMLYIGEREFALGSLMIVPYEVRERPDGFKVISASGAAFGLGLAPYLAELKVTGQNVTIDEVVLPAYPKSDVTMTGTQETIELEINAVSAEDAVIYYLSPIIRYHENGEAKEYALEYFTCGVFLQAGDVSKIVEMLGA